jgi:hypothetical protein
MSGSMPGLRLSRTPKDFVRSRCETSDVCFSMKALTMLTQSKRLSVALCCLLLLYGGAAMAQSGPSATSLAPNVQALNPQPLPPKEIAVPKRNNDLTALNPQPLPPKAHATIAIKSLREIANMTPETMVNIAGRDITVKALREQVAVAKITVGESSNAMFKFNSRDLAAPINNQPLINDEAARARDLLDRYAGGSQGRLGGGRPSGAGSGGSTTIQWLKHELPKSRWKLVSCADTSESRGSVNHCAGNDMAGAQADARCVTSGLEMRVNGTGFIASNFCSVHGGSRAGGFHTKYNASNFEKKSGIDVYEMTINPACRWEHWWSAPYNTTVVDSMSPQPGVVRAIVRWTTDRCVSAKATFLGATVDEDYACITAYFNHKASAECPAGVMP